MVIPPARPNLLQRQVHNISASQWGARILSQTFHHIDAPILRASHGRFALSSLLTGVPIVLVTTTGAKSGQLRSMPLLAFSDGDKVILIASNWGGSRYPAWYHNLRAHPNAQVTYHGETQAYRAREAVGQEYEAYWKHAASIYKGYDAYKTRTGGRPIPIVVLEPT